MFALNKHQQITFSLDIVSKKYTLYTQAKPNTEVRDLDKNALIYIRNVEILRNQW